MQICADLEGYADKIVAAFLGGLNICGYSVRGEFVSGAV